MQAMGFERILGGVCAPEGFLAAGVSCGIKGEAALDLAMVYSERPAAAAGLFTTNRLESAAVTVSRQRLEDGTAQAVVINSGNANCMTGEQGLVDALATARAVEEALGIENGQALIASTGRIGEYMPMEKVLKGVEQAVKELSPGGNTDAAKAIMTTDTYPKELAVEMEIGGRVVRMGGMAKGSGMIHPHLATMICVVTTDAHLDPDTLQEWLGKAVEWSFNRISVDGDRSTNDTVVMLANGAAFPGGYAMTKGEAELFFRALCWLTANLAMALVRDGEGAGKVIRLVVNGAVDDYQAVEVARSVANSNLVKCSIYGGKLDWGRIAAAAGAAGAAVDADRLEILIGEHVVASAGRPAQYDVGEVEKILSRDEVEITLELGSGEGSAYFFTADLTPEYVTLNSSGKN